MAMGGEDDVPEDGQTPRRSENGFRTLARHGQARSSSDEKKPSNVRIFWVDILTFDGFLGADFDILKPRRLPT